MGELAIRLKYTTFFKHHMQRLSLFDINYLGHRR